MGPEVGRTGANVQVLSLRPSKEFTSHRTHGATFTPLPQRLCKLMVCAQCACSSGDILCQQDQRRSGGARLWERVGVSDIQTRGECRRKVVQWLKKSHVRALDGCRQIAMRISFASFVFFGIHAVALLWTTSVEDPRVHMPSGFWSVKVAAWIGALIGVFHWRQIGGLIDNCKAKIMDHQSATWLGGSSLCNSVLPVRLHLKSSLYCRLQVQGSRECKKGKQRETDVPCSCLFS